MLLSILSSGNLRQALIALLLTLPSILFALAFHETAHGYVAYKCGDKTAYNLGRLTLNPLAHIDPIGFLSMLVFGFGWARPVPINSRNFKNPKRGMALSALAGPMANLLLGLISGVLSALFLVLAIDLDVRTPLPDFWVTCLAYAYTFFYYAAQINLLFMFFNLIPCPPFDGSRIALLFLPTQTYFRLMRYERQIMIGVLVAVMVLAYVWQSPFSWLAVQSTELIHNNFSRLFATLFDLNISSII